MRSALPLFATGLGALGLLGWRRSVSATLSSPLLLSDVESPFTKSIVVELPLIDRLPRLLEYVGDRLPGGGLTVLEVPAGHDHMASPPHSKLLAEYFNACLDGNCARPSSPNI